MALIGWHTEFAGCYDRRKPMSLRVMTLVGLVLVLGLMMFWLAPADVIAEVVKPIGSSAVSTGKPFSLASPDRRFE